MTAVAHIDDYRPHRSGIYLPSSASPDTPPTPATKSGERAPEQREPATPVATVESADGRTQRVRALEVEVAEREELAALQAQRAETHVESEATLKLRQQSADAEDKRRELANPARIALRDARAQLWANLVGFLAAFIALGWSTANVQATAALGTTPGSAAWWLAWGVEPLISAALLTVMGASAYLATRGVTVTDWWVTAAKWVPLGYTVTLNCWTSLPQSWITHPAAEFARGLLVHSVGPAVVVLLVHALPVLWAAFIGLHTPPGGPLQKPPEQDQPAPVDLDRARELLALVRPAHAAGEVTTGVGAIRRYLAGHGYRVGAPMGMWIRDALKREETA